MNLIVFLSFFLSAFASAACRPDSVPQTLDLANAKTVAQLQKAITLKGPEDDSFCQETLADKKKDILTWTNFLDQNVNHMAASEEKWAQGILSRKVPMDAGEEVACEQWRDLDELSDFYQRARIRKEGFEEKFVDVAMAVKALRAEKEIFAHPKKAKELIACIDDYMEQGPVSVAEEYDPESDLLERREACFEQVGASTELIQAVELMEMDSSGTALSLACALDPGARAAAMENLRLAEKIESGLKTLITDGSNYFDALNSIIPGRFSQIAAHRDALAAWQCPAWLAAEGKKWESSIRKLQGVNIHGSGFVLKGPRGKRELVSARHVGFEKSGLEANKLVMLGIHAEKQPRHGIQFEVKPGSYDRGKDLIKRELSSARTAFTAVAEGTVVPAGERVRIFGYPANRDGKFTSHGCEMRGIGRNQFDTPSAESYLLSCPGAESHIAGMSGGPVTNAKGEVIGIVSAHNPITNMVVVQPVSRNAAGENLFGFQRPFHSENCFAEADISRPKPCQVIPGQTYEKSIP